MWDIITSSLDIGWCHFPKTMSQMLGGGPNGIYEISLFSSPSLVHSHALLLLDLMFLEVVKGNIEPLKEPHSLNS